MDNEFYFGVMEMFWDLVEVMVAQHCECCKCHCIVHIKIVSFMLCEFYLNKLLKINETENAECDL